MDGEDSEWWDHLEELLGDELEDSEDDTDEGEVPDEFDDLDSVDISEILEDPHNAPDNEAYEGWELANHFDFAEDARNYCAGTPIGPLWIVYYDDGSADVFVDREYGEAA